MRSDCQELQYSCLVAMAVTVVVVGVVLVHLVCVLVVDEQVAHPLAG